MQNEQRGRERERETKRDEARQHDGAPKVSARYFGALSHPYTDTDARHAHKRSRSSKSKSSAGIERQYIE